MKLILGDCLEKLKEMEENSVDSIVTDPPYGLSFMGKKWDYDVPQVEVWKEAMRVLKPGGFLLAFAGTRTQHRMAVNIEDAGFEIRDMIAWVYGSGFPKSHNIGKAVDKIAPRLGQFDKFAKHLTEQIKVSGKTQKEIAKLFPSKTGGFTGCVWNWANGANVPTVKQWKILKPLLDLSDEFLPLIERIEREREIIGKGSAGFLEKNNVFELDNKEYGNFNLTKGTSEWEGWGTALKPALEPITVARKPFKGTVANNVLKHGTGGINIDGCRVKLSKGENTKRKVSGHKTSYIGGEMKKNFDIENQADRDLGRFPANLIHDGSDEVVGLFPETKTGAVKNETNNQGKFYGGGHTPERPANSGSASRFFYCAKASKSERNRGTNNYLIIKICVENMALAQLPKKVISEETTKWFTELFGKKNMEKYQMDFKFTTEMGTKKTTTSLILSCLHRLNIKDFIQDAIKMKKENGGNPVENVENTKEWKQIIINGLTEYLLGVNPAVLKTQLKISVNENNFHSTVKPIKLMQYLVRLVTPKGGTVLDPFMGSGSTGKACVYEGFDFIGIEMDAEYIKIAKARIDHAQKEQDSKLF